MTTSKQGFSSETKDVTIDSEKGNYHQSISLFLESLAKEDFNSAQVILESLVEDYPLDPMGSYCSGLFLLRLKDLPKALSALKVAAEHRDSYYEFIETCAIVSSLVGNRADALYYGKLAPSCPPHPVIEHLLPEWLGDFETSLMASQPSKIQTRRWLINGNNEVAINYLVDLLNSQPHDPELWSDLLLFLEMSERYSDIVSCSFALADIRPLSCEETCRLAIALSKNHQQELALEKLTPFLKTNNLKARQTLRIIDDDKSLPKSYLSEAKSLYKSTIKPIIKRSSSQPTIALISSNWKPLHLPTLIAPLFYLATKISKKNKIILLNDSPQKSLTLSLLQNRFSHSFDCHSIDSITLSTIIYNMGTDVLINLDGIHSKRLEVLYNDQQRPSSLLVDLMDNDLKAEGLGNLTLGDDIIYPQEFDKLLSVPGGLFCFDDQQSIEFLDVPTDFTIGVLANPCHLSLEQPLYEALKQIDEKLPKAQLLFSSDHCGGIDAVKKMEALLDLKNISITYSPHLFPLEQWCEHTSLVINAQNTLDSVYSFACLLCSVPVLHLHSEAPVTRVISSLLSSIKRQHWSLSNSQELVGLICQWQEDRSGFQLVREQLSESLKEIFAQEATMETADEKFNQLLNSIVQQMDFIRN